MTRAPTDMVEALSHAVGWPLRRAEGRMTAERYHWRFRVQTADGETHDLPGPEDWIGTEFEARSEADRRAALWERDHAVAYRVVRSQGAKEEPCQTK